MAHRLHAEHSVAGGREDLQVARPGPLRVETKRIAPGETNTWTIEIDGTEGSIAYTTKLPKTRKEYYLAEDVGHYGIFNGRKWREKIAPVVETFIETHEG